MAEINPIDISTYYSKITNHVETKLKFKGKSIQEWQKDLSFPDISSYITEEELLSLNKKSIKLFEIIYQNASIAKTHLTAIKAAYNKAINLKKEEIRQEIEDHNKNSQVKRKMPSIDYLETQANNACIVEQQAVIIAEMFYDFWALYIQNIQMYNSRITSLNISKHYETKLSNS